MRDFSKNVKDVTLVFLFCFVGLIAYIAYFQVFKGYEISSKEQNPRIAAKRDQTLRGTIYDSKGNVLAESVRDEKGNQVRKYPYGELYGAVIGYSHPQFGRMGFEREVDKALITSKQDSTMDFLKEKGTEGKQKVGNSVVCTIDTDLQKAAHDALTETGFNGSIVAMDPKTGDILTMVATPTYDANDMDGLMEYANSGEAPSGYLFNKATQGLLPPGSIFKTMTMATALEENFKASTRKFKDPGYKIFGKVDDMKNKNDINEQIELSKDGSIYVLHNFDSSFQYRNDRGMVDLQTAFRYSSNVVFGTLGQEVGGTILRESAEEYGFNSDINGIGIRAQASEFPEAIAEAEAAQSAIGQYQVRTTTLQMAMMVSAIANDGTLMTPKMIKEIKNAEGEVVKTYESEIFKKDVMPEKVAKEVKKNMRAVVEPNEYNPGYPSFQYFQGTNAGGKTGTADWVADNGELGKPHAWFVSIAPIEDPQIAIAVVCENGKEGSGPAAQVAAKVVSYYLKNKQ